MTKPLLALSAVLMLAAGLVLAGCATTKGSGATTTASDPAVGHPLPDIELPDLATGEATSIADVGGRVVLLDFWATWCAPCTKSLPAYEALQTELGARGFAVIAVSVDEVGAPVAEFAARLAPSVQVLLDPEGTSPAALALPGLPVAFLVGRDGVVRSRHVGFHAADVEALRAEIETLLAEPGG